MLIPFDQDLKVGAGEPTAGDLVRVEPVTLQAQPIEVGSQVPKLEPCVEEAAKQHISAGSGEAVKVTDSHR